MDYIPYYQHSGTGDQCHTEGQVSQEVGDWGTHSMVETEVIDEIEAKTTAHVVHLQVSLKYVYTGVKYLCIVTLMWAMNNNGEPNKQL